jgi:hypothetical protein
VRSRRAAQILRPQAGSAIQRRRELRGFKPADEIDVSDKPQRIRQLPLLETAAIEELERFRRLRLEALPGVDWMIASLVERLWADGRLDKTWIIFTSDKGLMMGGHRLTKGKACPYEERARVPLLVVPSGGLASPVADEHLTANQDDQAVRVAARGDHRGAQDAAGELGCLAVNEQADGTRWQSAPSR